MYTTAPGNTHSTFGQRIYLATMAPALKVFRRSKYVIPSLAILGFAIFVTIMELRDPGYITDLDWGWIISAGLALIGLVLSWFTMFRLRIYNEVVVYEKGLVLKSGSFTNEIPFSGVNNVSNLVRESTFSGLIPVFVSTKMSISGPGVNATGNELTLAASRTPHIRQTAVALQEAHADFALGGITAANIKEKEISFGDNVVLKNGQFAYKDKRFIPLAHASIDQDSKHVRILGAGERFTLSRVNIENESLLYAIVRKFSSE